VSARCESPKGTPENRMTRAEIEEKFERGAKDRLAREQLRSVLDGITRSGALVSAPSLMHALRTDTT